MKQFKLPMPVKLAIFVAFIIMVVTLVGVQIEYNQLEEERDKLLLELEDIQGEVDELQNKLDTPFDEEYIIALAKEKLGYCLPEEIIFYNDLIN